MKLSDNYKEIAQKLIAIPSVTKDIAACNAAMEFVKSRLSKYSVKTFEKDNRKSLLFSNQPFPVKTFTVLSG